MQKTLSKIYIISPLVRLPDGHDKIRSIIHEELRVMSLKLNIMRSFAAVTLLA
jgi:hypothetical protein